MNKMTATRVSRIAVVAVVVLLVGQFISYHLVGKRTLVTTIAGHLPSKQFCSQVYLPTSLIAPLNPSQARKLIALLNARYDRVYLSETEIPATARLYSTDEKRSFIRYSDLCQLGFAVRTSGPFWFTASFSDYEGPLSARGEAATYVWVGYRWLRVWASGRVVA